MGDAESWWAKLHARSSAVLRPVLGALTVWSVLAALGLAPTAAAIIAVVIAVTSDQPTTWLWPVLGLSLVTNLLLALIAIRGWRYARDLESDIELVVEKLRAGREEPAPWLPSPDGSLNVSNATLERAYEEALSVARDAVGRDAEIGLGWIMLTPPVVAMHAWSATGQKETRVWWVPGRRPSPMAVQRRTRPVYAIKPPQWREDSSWTDLIRLSWAVETPFTGTVTLWPRSDYEHAEGEGHWRLEYTPIADGVHGRPTKYILAGGALKRDQPATLPVPAERTPGPKSPENDHSAVGRASRHRRDT